MKNTKMRLSSHRKAQMEISGANEHAYEEEHQFLIESRHERVAAKNRSAKRQMSNSQTPIANHGTKKSRTTGAADVGRKSKLIKPKTEKRSSHDNSTHHDERQTKNKTTSTRDLQVRVIPNPSSERFPTDPMLVDLSEIQERLCQATSLKIKIKNENFAFTESDIEGVLGNSEINDMAMNAFAGRLILRIQDSNIPIWIYSTFFTTAMHNEKKTKGGTELIYSYSKVKRWVSRHKINFADQTGLLIPCHVDTNHWVLYILQPKKKALTCYNPMCDFPTPSTSLYANSLLQWYHDEMASKFGKEFAKTHYAVSSWSIGFITLYPKQSDTVSCGVFVLFAMEYISRRSFGETRDPWEYVLPFVMSDMEKLRKRIIYHIKSGFL